MADKRHTANEHGDLILKPDLSITFKGKASLKRSEATGIPLEDEAAIAVMEGDSAHNTANNGLTALYEKTRLHPDKKIVFPTPAALKKKPAIMTYYARYAAAAVILLLLSIGTWYLQRPGTATESSRYELTKLQLIEPEVNNSRPIQMELSSRMAENMQVSISVRENVEINTLGSLANAPLINPSLTGAMDIGFQFRPSGSQQLLADNQGQGKKGLLGRIFSGFFNRVSAPFESDENESEKSSGDGFLWNVAQLGVKSVNALGDHDYTLVRDYNEKGNVKGLIVLDE